MANGAAERGRLALGGLRHPVVWTGLLLVLAQQIHRGIVLSRNWFYTDDYVLLLAAQDRGLTWAHLLEPFNSHLMPATRFIYWLVASAGTLNWSLAVTATLLVQLLASVSALWMLLTLFGRRWGTVGLLAVYLTTAITAQATLWWVSSINQLSIQAAFFLAVGAWVNYLRTRRGRWLLTTAAAVGFGLLFFQKVLLVLPVLVALGFCYFTDRPGWAGFVGFVRRYWPSAVVIGVLSGGYLAYYLLRVQQPFASGATDWLALAWNMVSTAVTGSLGGPWTWQWHSGGAWADTPLWLQVEVLAVATALVVWSLVVRRHAWPAWLLLGGYVAAQVVLVGTSRAPVFGSDIGLAYRFQTDVVCAAVLCVGLALMPLRGAPRSSSPRPGARLPRVPTSVVLAATVVVAGSGVVSWTLYERLWHEHNTGEQYLRTLSAGLRHHEGAHLLDTWVPPSVLSPAVFAPHNTVSTIVPLLGVEVRFPDSSHHLLVASERGRLHHAAIDPVTSSEPGPREGCGWLARDGAGVRIPLSSRLFDSDWWLRVGYLSDADDDVLLSAGGNSVVVQLHRGLNSLLVQVDGAYDAVELSGLDEGTDLCVDEVEVGRPVNGPVLD